MIAMTTEDQAMAREYSEKFKQAFRAANISEDTVFQSSVVRIMLYIVKNNACTCND